jgi:hypothetical protein
MPATTDHSFALARRRVRRLLLLLRRHCARTDNHRQPQPRVLKLRANKANRVGLTANRAALLLVGVSVHRLLVVRAAAAARCSRGRHGGDEPTKTATTHTTSARRHRAQPNTSPRATQPPRAIQPPRATEQQSTQPTNRCDVAHRVCSFVWLLCGFFASRPRAPARHTFLPAPSARSPQPRCLTCSFRRPSARARERVGHPPNANAQHSTTDTPRASHSQGRLVPRGARSRLLAAVRQSLAVRRASGGGRWRCSRRCAGVARFGRFVVFVVCGVVVVVVAPAGTGSPLRVDVASVADAGSTARVAHCKLCVGEAQRK